MLDKNKALVVFSGGQDSTTCLFWALKRFSEVHAICFRYGQKHQIETEYAAAIAKEVSANIRFFRENHCSFFVLDVHEMANIILFQYYLYMNVTDEPQECVTLRPHYW